MNASQKDQPSSFVKRQVNYRASNSSSTREFRSWRDQSEPSAAPLPDSYLKQRQPSKLPSFFRNRELHVLVAVLGAVAIAYAVFHSLTAGS